MFCLSHRQNELKEGAQRSVLKQYYYIDYQHFCNVVKWRVAEMRRRIAALSVALFFCHLAPAAAQTGELVDRSELKVCADPNNLPFSDEGKDGFENKIAELIGDELGLKVDYVWFPQVIGFVRNTLRAHLCDLVIGTVAGDEVMQTTNPYYFTTYAMLYRSDKGLELDGLQDPRLAGLHLGVVAGTPPADLLARYDLMSHTKPYALSVDTRAASPIFLGAVWRE